MRTLARHRCFGGTIGFYAAVSDACGGEMKVGVFTPSGTGPFPVLFYLAGLTCTEETFLIKAGAPQLAAELGLMLVACDTSPRGAGIPGEDDDWDFGTGAGFYVDATEPPWSRAYRMYSHVTHELPDLIARHFPADPHRLGICGHSMGGHGALVCALRNPDRYRSVSALAPVVAPTLVPWGRKAFTRYLGPQEAIWAAYDACALVRQRRHPGVIRIDQGREDQFLATQLRPDLFETACREAGQALELHWHPGYDHSYWFIQSVIAHHLHHHARALAPD